MELAGENIVCWLLLFKKLSLTPEEARCMQPAVCLCVCSAPLTASAVSGLSPLTLTEGEMSLKYEIPISFRKSRLPKHVGFVPVPATQQD